MLDLRGIGLSPGALRELVVPLGQRVKGGVYGDAKLVVISSDAAVLEIAALYAQEFDIPVFLASSVEDIPSARPAGGLTPTEAETLEKLRGLGGYATVAGLATHVSIEPTAASNRLANLERKGYLFRVERSRTVGDLFMDPRTFQDAAAINLGVVKTPREALRAAGIHTDPYDTSPLVLEGDAAARAAEIVRRRSGN